MADTFAACRDLLSEDGSLWIVIGDNRRRNGKLMIPHRLALKLVERGYTLREDIIWYKKNSIAGSSRESFSQAYEIILFLSKNEKSYTNMQDLRIKGNEAREGRNKVPPTGLIQYKPINQDREKISKIKATTTEIAQAYGYDPEKYCPTCYCKIQATCNTQTDRRSQTLSNLCSMQL